MKKIALTAASLLFFACSSESSMTKVETTADENTEEVTVAAKAIDYSKGRAMNKRLGKGINFGNAWESACYYNGNIPSEPYNYGYDDRLDNCWSNAIKDEYFELAKQTGFNSVRIPVRWQHNSNPETHEVNPERIDGVMEDVQLAIDAGLAVVISFHWYYEMMEAANNADTDPDAYAKELEHFTSIWTQVATAFDKFPDSLLVWDILNEPTMKAPVRLNEVMTAGYEAIRKAAPGKTIMFESYHAAKFADITALKLPEDGNIIYSGHYYEPYNYSHQGHSDQYKCTGDAAYAMTAFDDFASYVRTVHKLYPDVNGSEVPMNMGEFGVTGPNTGGCSAGTAPSDRERAKWTKYAIQAAEKYDMSWHYWGLVGVGGFEAYDKRTNKWYDGFPAAFGL